MESNFLNVIEQFHGQDLVDDIQTFVASIDIKTLDQLFDIDYFNSLPVNIKGHIIKFYICDMAINSISSKNYESNIKILDSIAIGCFNIKS